jgi:hypothetical protein
MDRINNSSIAANSLLNPQNRHGRSTENTWNYPSNLNDPVPDGIHPSLHMNATMLSSRYRGYSVRKFFTLRAQETTPYSTIFQCMSATGAYAPNVLHGKLTDTMDYSRQLSLASGARQRMSEWDRYRSTACLPALNLPGFLFKGHKSDMIDFDQELASYDAPPRTRSLEGSSIRQAGHIHSIWRTWTYDSRTMVAWLLGMAHHGVKIVATTDLDRTSMLNRNNSSFKSCYGVEICSLLQTGAYTHEQNPRGKQVFVPTQAAFKIAFQDLQSNKVLTEEDIRALSSIGAWGSRDPRSYRSNEDIAALNANMQSIADAFNPDAWLADVLRRDLRVNSGGACRFPTLEALKKSDIFLGAGVVSKLLEDMAYLDQLEQSQLAGLAMAVTESPRDERRFLGRKPRYSQATLRHMGDPAALWRNIANVALPSQRKEYQEKRVLCLPAMIKVLPFFKDENTRRAWHDFIQRESSGIQDESIRQSILRDLGDRAQERHILHKREATLPKYAFHTSCGKELRFAGFALSSHVASDIGADDFMNLLTATIFAIRETTTDFLPSGMRHDWCGYGTFIHKKSQYRFQYEGSEGYIRDLTVQQTRTAPNGTDMDREIIRLK